MLRPRLKLLLPALLTGAAVMALSLWIHHFFNFTVEQRLPGADNRPDAITPAGGPEKGTLEKSGGVPSPVEGSWPCFRGSDGDAIDKKSVPLLRDFSAGGPKELWRVRLTEGYAGAAVWKGRVYIIDYDTIRRADAIRCLSLDDGAEIWRYSYPVTIARNNGITRTVPAVADGYVVAMGPKCQVTCLNAETGRFIWGIDLVGRYGTKVPPWYALQCPRIENGHAIIAPGGKALMVAVECATGRVAWESDNPDQWRMTHSSVLPVHFAGKKAYVYCADRGVAGVDAENGDVLWKTDAWKFKVIMPTPVDMGNGRLFFCAGYKMGSMVLHLKDSGGTITPQVWSTIKAKDFGSDFQTPVWYRNSLFGVGVDGELTCLDTNGEVLWKSGEENVFGLGSFMIADGMIIILDDVGVVSFVAATPDSFSVIARSRVLEGSGCRAPPALVQGRLLLRDRTTMVCLDIRKKRTEG